MANKKNYHKYNYNRKPYKNANQRTVEMPMDFAKALMKQVTYNPKNSNSRSSRSYSVYSKDRILNWLQNPSSDTNQKNLRDASNYMYISSMHYNRLLNYYAGLYTGAYVISPLSFKADSSKESFVKQYRKVSEAIELMNIPAIMREELLVAMREGAFYGVLLSDNNSAFIQMINPEYCKITSICDGSFLYQVDMSQIGKNLEFYPAEFSKMYSDYLRTGEKWQEVPVNISVCIKADSTTIESTIPTFAAVMPSLYSIAASEITQETTRDLDNYKMLAGQIPTDDKGRPLMSRDMVNGYYADISNALGERIGLALSPFKFETFSFENKSKTADIDEFGNAVANFWSTAGTSGLLHGRENDTSGVTRLAIKNDETYVLGMIKQFERVINRYLKTNFTGSNKFKISILPVTVFNIEDYLKYYKEAASFGIGKSQYAAILGISQNDLAGLTYLEKETIPFDELVPLKSSYTISSNDVGRPQTEDSKLSDEGQATRDNDTNSNR